MNTISVSLSESLSPSSFFSFFLCDERMQHEWVLWIQTRWGGWSAKAVQGFYKNRQHIVQGRSDLALTRTDPLAASPGHYLGPCMSQSCVCSLTSTLHQTKVLETLMNMVCSVVPGWFKLCIFNFITPPPQHTHKHLCFIEKQNKLTNKKQAHSDTPMQTHLHMQQAMKRRDKKSSILNLRNRVGQCELTGCWNISTARMDMNLSGLKHQNER